MKSRWLQAIRIMFQSSKISSRTVACSTSCFGTTQRGNSKEGASKFIPLVIGRQARRT